MFKSAYFAIFVLAISAVTAAQNNEKLNILVLYESLCPDSERFMDQQLGPSYEALKDLIDINLVPFGKSHSYDNGAHFECQHGERECEGNRMQSCVLDQTIDQHTQVKFVVCQMTSPNKNNVKNCAENAGLSDNIDTCMNGQRGTNLQLQAEQITHSYAPTFVPTIIYDHVFNQQLQDNSIRDFRGTVCGLLYKRGDIGLQEPVCQ